MKGSPIAFQWQETPAGSFGPGLSRPAAPERAKPFTLRVKQLKARPVKVTLMAENEERAIEYAGNRWPGALVEVV